LEAHTRTEDSAQSRRFLEGQVRECYGRVVYSHKTHEKCADGLLTHWSHIKLAQIVLSAVTAAGFFGVIFGAAIEGAIAGAVVSTALLGLNAYVKNYDLGELAQKHRQTATDLWLVRERLQSLLVDIAMKEKPLEALQQQRDDLITALHGIYSGAPSTTSKAYREAQKALKFREDMTFNDAEIDALLPQELRRTDAKPGEGENS
jgi:hypothetical protein